MEIFKVECHDDVDDGDTDGPQSDETDGAHLHLVHQHRLSGRSSVHHSACSWSQTDRFFVLTEFAVEIFIRAPSPSATICIQDLHFDRYTIPRLHCETITPIEPEPESLDRYSLLETLLGRKEHLPFNPEIPDFEEKIVAAAWAPADSFRSRSLPLAVLSASGNLRVVGTEPNAERPPLNVTAAFPTDAGDGRFTSAVAWLSRKVHDQIETYLVCGQSDGTVLLLPMEEERGTTLRPSSPRELTRLNSRPNAIHSILDDHSSILVAAIDGTLRCLSPFSDSGDFDLWPERDRLRVDCIVSVDQERRTFIYFAKRCHLLLAIVEGGRLIGDMEMLATASLPFVGAAAIGSRVVFQTVGGEIYSIDGRAVRPLRWSSPDVWKNGMAAGLCFSPCGTVGMTFVVDSKGSKRKMGVRGSDVVLFRPPRSFASKAAARSEWSRKISRRSSKDSVRCLTDRFLDYLQSRVPTQPEDEELKSLREEILYERAIESLKNRDRRKATDSGGEEIRRLYRFVLNSKFLRKGDSLLLSRIGKSFGDIANEPANECPWCEERFDGLLCSENHPRQWCFVTLRDIEFDCFVCKLCGAAADGAADPPPECCIFCNTKLVKTNYSIDQT